MPADIIVELAEAVRSFLDVEDSPIYDNPDIVLVRSQSTTWLLFQVTKNYTRGNGFSQDEDGVWHVDEALQGVIVSTTARYGALGPAKSEMSLTEWSPMERSVLHHFRRIAG